MSTQSFVVSPAGVPTPIDLVQLARGHNATIDARTVVWASSDPSVADVTLSTSGATSVVGHNAGSATLTANYAGVEVEVPVRITSAQVVDVGVSVQNSIPSGTSRRIAAIATYDDGSRADVTAIATFSSAQSSVARITHEKGIGAPGAAITGVAPGETVVTAQLPAMGAEPTTVIVTGATLNWIGVEGSSRLLLNAPARFKAVGHFSDNSSADLTDSVTWAVRAPQDALGEPIPDLVVGEAIVGDEPGVVIPTGVGAIEVYVALDGADGQASPVISAEPPVAIRIDTDLGQPVAQMPKGLTQAFRAWFVFADGTEESASSYVVWMTDSDLATIGNGRFDAGLLRARGVGTVTVSALYGDLVGSVTLALTDAQLVSLALPTGAWGGTLFTPNAWSGFHLIGTFDDASVHDMGYESVFESSDASCVSVDPMGGRFATHERGHCTITASYGDVSTSIDVVLRPVTAVTLVDPTALVAGETTTIVATGEDSLGQVFDINPYIQWASPDPSVATVSNERGTKGLVTAMGGGDVYLTATFDGNAWPVHVVVTPTP